MYRQKVTADDFDRSKTQPRFIAFLRAHSLKPGDTWVTIEFMRWASAMASEFRRERGLSEGEYHDHSELTAWIKEKVDS